MSKNRGFTLIEIMVVVIILSVIAGIILLSVNEVRKGSRDTQRKSDLQQLQLALKLYAVANDGYPTENQIGTHRGFFDGVIGISANDPDRLLQPYLTAPIKDPLHDGSEYFYYYDGYYKCTREPDDPPAPPNKLEIVVYAMTMERPENANHDTLCTKSDTEPAGHPSDDNAYIILIPGLQTQS